MEEKWEQLIDEAKEEYVFGNPVNMDLFVDCMKSAFDLLVINHNEELPFNRFETGLYGLIKGYSCIPAITLSEYSEVFEASTHAASFLAHAIVTREAVIIENSVIIDRGYAGIDQVIYDFEEGDLTDFIELVRMGYWD